MKTYTTTVLADPDDPEGCIIEFPAEMIEKLEWKDGDTIGWEVLDDGSAILTNTTKNASVTVKKSED